MSESHNAIAVKQVSFAYAGNSRTILDGISFEIAEGSFTVLAGLSGSGKSTLLRLMKPELTLEGVHEGEISIFGRPIETYDSALSARLIGFVGQDPEAQIVMDTVEGELAFGLENLAYPTSAIQRRVAEVAHFFGIGDWFGRRTAELSGGCKQMLSLAAVVAMRPRLLVLDEPTSQLDPTAAESFLTMLHKVNIELGTTIVLCEHRLEGCLGYADKALLLEKGKIVCNALPSDFAGWVVKNRQNMQNALPASCQAALVEPVRKRIEQEGLLTPLTVRDGRFLLGGAFCKPDNFADDFENHAEPSQKSVRKKDKDSEGILSLREAWFRYERKEPFILRGCTFSVKKGSIHAIVGGNGSGKSTLLGILAGVRKPTSGKLVSDHTLRTALLPQDPRQLFMHDTVKEELGDLAKKFSYGEEEIDVMKKRFNIEHLFNQHPFDLSGGETAKVALVKLLLIQPDILLLDEVARGLDVEAKHEIGTFLRAITQQGITVIMVSHDLDFVSQTADSCSMLFGGQVTCSDTSREFLKSNIFFTTATNRMTRGILEDCVVPGDVLPRAQAAIKEAENQVQEVKAGAQGSV